MRDEVIFFADAVPSGERDGNGDPVLTEKRSDAVYAEIRSVGQNEFWQSQTSDFKPELKFKITDREDYQGQKYLVYDGMRYKILRVFGGAGENGLEITCYGGVRDAAAAVGDEDKRKRS